MNRFGLILLRACNLLTVFNLLLFTINEYILIRRPMHYRHLVRWIEENEGEDE